VGGQATKLWKHYFDKIDAIVFVIDSTDEEKLLFARDEFQRILRDPALEATPALVFFNKSDLAPAAKNPEYLATKLDLENLAKSRPIIAQQCSAVSGNGIWEGID
jgi:signal recognition particle receptor subunit beta